MTLCPVVIGSLVSNYVGSRWHSFYVHSATVTLHVIACRATQPGTVTLSYGRLAATLSVNNALVFDYVRVQFSSSTL